MAPPAPVIQASSSPVAVGENLRVSCSVVGEQDVGVEITWEYPGQEVRQRLQRFVTQIKRWICVIDAHPLSFYLTVSL